MLPKSNPESVSISDFITYNVKTRWLVHKNCHFASLVSKFLRHIWQIYEILDNYSKHLFSIKCSSLKQKKIELAFNLHYFNNKLKKPLVFQNK